MLDIDRFVSELHDYIGKAVEPLKNRIKELESVRVEISHDDILHSLKSDKSLMREVVADYLKDNPPPPGPQGERGEKGATGDRGEKGADGIGATGAMLDKSGELIVTLGNGTLERVGHVVGKDGADLTDLSFDYDGERTVSVKAGNGEVVKSYKMPVLIDKGYWRKGSVAEKGDCYTRDGGLWISLVDNNTTEPSAQTKEHWRLGVRKGRDGRNGKDGHNPSGTPLHSGDDQ